MKYCGTRCARSPQVPRAPPSLPALVSHRVHERGGRQLHRRQREALDQAPSVRRPRRSPHPLTRRPEARKPWAPASPRRARTPCPRWRTCGRTARIPPRERWRPSWRREPPRRASRLRISRWKAPPKPEKRPATPAAPARRSNSDADVVASVISCLTSAFEAKPRSAASGAARGRDGASAVSERPERFRDELERRFPPRVARREGRRRAVAVERDERAAPVVLGPGLGGGFRGGDFVLDHLR